MRVCLAEQACCWSPAYSALSVCPGVRVVQGVGAWSGFGPSAPFLCGGGLACLAALLMAWWMPQVDHQRSVDGTPATLSLLAGPR
jgi:hypothetical protein